jgi:hypothetical protein
MNRPTPPADYVPGRDPYFHGVDVGPAKSAVPSAHDPERRRRQFRIRSIMLVVVLVAVWLWVLLDPLIGPLVLAVLAWVAGTLALVGTAMGLGLLGFGICTTGDRIIGWLRRSLSWPEE